MSAILQDGAHVAWDETKDIVYIRSIGIGEASPKTLAVMLSRFRKRFRGYEILFDAADDNAPMQRLVSLLGAKVTSKTYRVQL